MIDMLASTGMRVGEMVLLNKADINFNERECIVFGKGDKEHCTLLLHLGQNQIWFTKTISQMNHNGINFCHFFLDRK